MNPLTRKFLPLLIFTILLAGGCAKTQVYPSCTPALTPATQERAKEWWMPRHEVKLNEEGRENARLLFIGDSITHRWESTGEETWNEYFADYGGYNIGYSADRTEHVLWRLQNGEVDGIHPELAILMIGTNNTGHRQDQPECTAEGIELILDELEQRLPDTKVLLLAIFPREASPDGELRQLNNEINKRIENLADGERVFFLNINDTFLNDDGSLSEEIMPDLLHPNEYGYELWARAMQPKLTEILED